MSKNVFLPDWRDIRMKRLMIVLSLVVGAWMLSPTPEAQAWSWSWSRSGGDCENPTYQKGGTAVPELDPSAAGSAMVLLLGGMALIASRRREEDVA
jgi:hypothetical protein